MKDTQKKKELEMAAARERIKARIVTTGPFSMVEARGDAEIAIAMNPEKMNEIIQEIIAERNGGLEKAQKPDDTKQADESGIIYPLDIKVGDKVTVAYWHNNKDRSYIGDLLTVKHVSLPFVFVERQTRYSGRKERMMLDLDEVCLERLPAEFVAGFEWMISQDAA